MKELNITYQELMWGIPWATLIRMMADLPRQVKVDKNQPQTLTEQNVDDFKTYMQNINEKNKKKQ